MKKITALFTAVCGWPTHGTVNALRSGTHAEYTIIGADCNPNDGALNYVDHLYKVPRCDDPDYIPSLMRLCEKHDVDIIIPLISDEIGVFWENMDSVAASGVKLLLSGKDSLLPVANDKFLLAEFLKKNGCGFMPKTYKFNAASVEEDLMALGYPDLPVAVKLSDACGGNGFKILDDKKSQEILHNNTRASRVNPYITKEQLLSMGEQYGGRYLLQEFLPGEELGTLCLVDHGRTVYSPSHRNYEMQYATTTNCELVDCEEANRIVRKVNGLLRLDGNIGFDFKRNGLGELKLMEINPRISATVSLAAKAGLNLVEMGVLHALGEDIEEGVTPMYGMKMQRVYGTLYSYKGKAYGV